MRVLSCLRLTQLFLVVALALIGAPTVQGLDFSAYTLFHHESYVGEFAYPTSPETDLYCAGGLEGALAPIAIGAQLTGTTAHADSTLSNLDQVTHVAMGSRVAAPTAVVAARGRFDGLAVTGDPVDSLIVVLMAFGPDFQLSPQVFALVEWTSDTEANLVLGENDAGVTQSGSSVALDGAAVAALLSGAFSIDLSIDRLAGLATASVESEGSGLLASTSMPLVSVTTSTEHAGTLQGLTYGNPPLGQAVVDFTSLEQYTDDPALSGLTALALDFSGGVTPPAPGPTIGGWAFSVCHAVDVMALGLWDEGANGLANEHEIGLWTGDGSVELASVLTSAPTTAVPSALSPGGQWLFIGIPRVRLEPGTYLIGATFDTFDADLVHLQALAHPGPGIAYLENRLAPSSVLTPPLTTIPTEEAGYFGPNLLVQRSPLASELPGLGVAAAAIVGAAIACTGFLRVSRRRD